MTAAVRRSAELERVKALPRRAYTNEQLDQLARELSAVLKTPQGTMQLRRVQALALHDIGVVGGALLPIGVGEGKTLISLLASLMLGAERPMLLVPASLIKTATDAREVLAKHWRVPTNLRIFSSHMLSRVEHSRELETYRPDAIIVDEVHILKNLDAAVTKRVARYMADNPQTAFVGMSGTVMRKSLHDFAHLLRWALKLNAPLPMHPNDLAEWARALDEGPDVTQQGWQEKPDPGALLDFATPEDWFAVEGDPLRAARRGFRRRLLETPGVVASAGDGEAVGASIYVSIELTKMKPITDEHFALVRAFELPGGIPLSLGSEVWRHARELALGFHYEWDPRPPEWWMKPRKEWCSFVRDTLSRSRTLDSELQVAQAILHGRSICGTCNGTGAIPHPEDETSMTCEPCNGTGRGGERLQDGGVYARWMAVRKEFTPNTVAVWHDDTILRKCEAWGRKAPGIIWTEHALFAERLARETGFAYFGESGWTLDGQRHIEHDDVQNGPTIIASIRANKDGKNLQGSELKGTRGFARMLYPSPPEGWDVWQQSIARVHRPGQRADAVEIDVLFGCREHVNAWQKALEGTHAARDTVGSDAIVPKLLLADIRPGADELARQLERLTGARWRG